MDVCPECCVLSGRGLCDELITRPEESYRMWCVVVCDLETSWMRRPWPSGGLLRQKQTHRKSRWKKCRIRRHCLHMIVCRGKCLLCGILTVLRKATNTAPWCSAWLLRLFLMESSKYLPLTLSLFKTSPALLLRSSSSHFLYVHPSSLTYIYNTHTTLHCSSSLSISHSLHSSFNS